MSPLGVPKPSRTLRETAKLTQRLERQAARQAANAHRRYRDYGRVDGGEPWPVVKARVLARDEHRCLMSRCDTPLLGVTVHHIKHVGAGGKSVDWNACSLCAVHHDDRVLRQQAFYYRLYPRCVTARREFHVYVCLLPTLVLHLVWQRKSGVA